MAENAENSLLARKQPLTKQLELISRSRKKWAALEHVEHARFVLFYW